MSDPVVTLPQGWTAAATIAIVIQVLAPLVLAVVVQRRLGASWRHFAYGMLIFFLFQLVTRVPAVQVGQVLLQDALSSSPVVQWVWIGALSLSAGLFEEIGRWVGYRWLFRPADRTWRAAMMYGLGHGGLESMLLIAGLSAVSLAGLMTLSAADLAQLPPAQREAAQSQLAVLANQPGWLPLLGAWERLGALAIHVGLSIVVLQVFRRGSSTWLGLAILGHTLVNFVAVGLLTALGANNPSSAVVTELAISVMAVVALWAAWRLREPPRAASLEGV